MPQSLSQSFSTSFSAPRTAALGLTRPSGRACTPIWPPCAGIVIAQPTALGAPRITSISQPGWRAPLARQNSWRSSRRPPLRGLRPKESSMDHSTGREVMAISPSAGASWRIWCATSIAKSNIITPRHSRKSIGTCCRNTTWSSMNGMFGTDADWLVGGRLPRWR